MSDVYAVPRPSVVPHLSTGTGPSLRLPEGEVGPDVTDDEGRSRGVQVRTRRGPVRDTDRRAGGVWALVIGVRVEVGSVGVCGPTPVDGEGGHNR